VSDEQTNTVPLGCLQNLGRQFSVELCEQK
jgi:hypothetical protein